MKFIKLHSNAIIEFLIVLTVATIAVKIIDYFDTRIRKKIISEGTIHSSRLLSFLPLINKILKVIIGFMVLASVLQTHGYSMSSLIAGFGITGLAIGFAAKEAIANILGSIALLLDKVYDIGDYILVNGVEGTVEDINLRSTKIKTPDDCITTIPNNIVANSIVQNISHIDHRRLDETFGITYDTSDEKINRALEILKTIISRHSEILDGENIFIEKFDASSINIRVIAFIKQNDILSLRRIKEDVFKELLTLYRQEGIEFAFPSQTLYLKNEN